VRLTERKRMKRKRFKKKTAVLSALQVLGCNPYGNTANKVETAPVPIFTANHAGGKWRILSVMPFFSDMLTGCVSETKGLGDESGRWTLLL
jgi:hypothetical protein